MARRVSASTDKDVRSARRRSDQRADAVEKEVDALLRRKAAKKDEHRRVLVSSSSAASASTAAAAATAAASAPVRRRPRCLQRSTPVS